MKLCILSMQHVQNMGSLLQAYALKKILTQLGHTVSFLDIEKNAEDNRLLNDRKKVFSLEQEGKNSLICKLKKLDRYTWNRLRNKKREREQFLKTDRFRKENLGIVGKENDGRFDCCVIGSDEVFNCTADSEWGFTGQLFGDVKQADRVISYGASAGATKPEDLPEAVARRIREAFQKVSAFSVRDRNTLRLVSALTDRQVQEHLDPVLVGDFEKELQDLTLPAALPRRYCVIYSYYNRIHSPEEVEAIEAFCAEKQLEIVAVGAPQKWIRNYLVLDPFEVLKVFENAAFVITDTFHGTIFSARFSERFAVMTRPSNENKLEDLIGRLEIGAHRITSFDQLETAYQQENDRRRIAELCAKERQRTICYLEENL